MIILLKAIGVWFVMVGVAIMNGMLRDKVLISWVGIQIALPLSGIILSALVFFITFLFIPFFGKLDGQTYIGIGVLWVFLTLAFEFLFGYFGAGKSLVEIAQVFNLFNGNLFLLVLMTTVISPWVSAKSRGFLS